MTSKSEIIRELNDRYRKGDHTVPGRSVITIGVQHLIARHPSYEYGDVMNVVAIFDAFTEENDPYGEHDFGAFDYLGERLFWKIDYYDNDLQGGSSDATDLTKTIRVLTVMLVGEY